jgi:hypothetical protein
MGGPAPVAPAPFQQQIVRDPNDTRPLLHQILDSRQNLYIKQTRKGCIREMMGCEDTSEFKIATMENTGGDIMYAIENSGCLIRLMCPVNRCLTMQISAGGQAGGENLMNLEMPWHCAQGSCCCIPTMIMRDHEMKDIGKASTPW